MQLRITSDSSTSHRYYSSPDAACDKIAAALNCTLVETNPYPSDGVTSAQALTALQAVPSLTDDIHLVLIGGNDPYHYSPWESVALSNVSDIIDYIQAHSSALILVSSQLTQKVQSITDALPAYHASLKALCVTKGVTYVPLNERYLWEAVQRLNQTTVTPLFRPDPDTGHTNVDGNTVTASVVKTAYDTRPLASGVVWNRLQAGTGLIYPPGDVSLVAPASTGGSAIGNTGLSSGVYDFTVTVDVAASTAAAFVGFTRGAYNTITNLSTTGADDYWYDSNGRKNTNGSPAEATGLATWNTVADVVRARLDITAGTLDFYKNGTLITSFTGLPAGTYYPIAGHLGGAASGNKITATF